MRNCQASHRPLNRLARCWLIKRSIFSLYLPTIGEKNRRHEGDLFPMSSQG